MMKSPFAEAAPRYVLLEGASPKEQSTPTPRAALLPIAALTAILLVQFLSG